MMLRMLPTALLLFLGILSTSLVALDGKPVAVPRLGINLSGLSDWNTELPFVDVFHLSRTWVSQKKQAGWGKGPALSLDEHGWVKQLDEDSWAETLLCTIEGGHYPAGEYTVLYEGEGKLDFSGAASIKRSQPGKLLIQVNPARGGFFLKLMKTNPRNYVRHIRVLMPGFTAAQAEANPWNPTFLNRWRGVACLRFMDFMMTNNSTTKKWTERPLTTDATYTTKGIPVELLVDLSNRLHSDPWICIPHEAEDDYVAQFADLVRKRLDPQRKVVLEYSNEVWNGQFKQHQYAGSQGVKLGFAKANEPWAGAWRYTAHRSRQIFAIWENAWGTHNRMIRVLPSQSVNPYVSDQVLTFEEAHRSADALAIAPYVGPAFGPQTKPSSSDVAAWSVDELFDYIEKEHLPATIKSIKAQKQVAEKYGLQLVAYEGGQHLVGIGGAENDERLTKLLHQANAHPRMGKVYDQYLQAWQREGGDLFCHFSSVGQWSKWGSWGLLEYADSSPQDAPKFLSAMRWAKQLGQLVP